MMTLKVRGEQRQTLGLAQREDFADRVRRYLLARYPDRAEGVGAIDGVLARVRRGMELGLSTEFGLCVLLEAELVSEGRLWDDAALAQVLRDPFATDRAKAEHLICVFDLPR